MQVQELYKKLSQQILGKYWLGQDVNLMLFFSSWISGGHVLVEGPPGTGKTLLAKLMAHGLSKSFKRIQFTSDLMPADILGANIYVPGREGYQFLPGPIFSDCVLADEINRAPPRTQSALLEAMEERQVTVDGVKKLLNPEFFVVATQNPHEFEGTFPLPEAQLDRFMIKVTVGHTETSVDQKIIEGHLNGLFPPPIDQLEVTLVDRAKVQSELDAVRVDESLLKFIAQLLTATRHHVHLSSGASVRGGLAIAKTARALALIQGRNFVTMDDLKAMTIPCLRHRIRLTSEATMSNETEVSVLGGILAKMEFPV